MEVIEQYISDLKNNHDIHIIIMEWKKTIAGEHRYYSHLVMRSIRYLETIIKSDILKTFLNCTPI